VRLVDEREASGVEGVAGFPRDAQAAETMKSLLESSFGFVALAAWTWRDSGPAWLPLRCA